jgi:hypothetical protein
MIKKFITFLMELRLEKRAVNAGRERRNNSRRLATRAAMVS